jgi:hypothetical protein
VIYLSFGKRDDDRHGFFMRVALNDELTQWSTHTIALGVQLPWDEQVPGRATNAYCSFLDESAGSANFDRIGETPWLYWVRTYTGDQTKLQREIWRVPVKFHAGAPERDNRVQGYFRVDDGGHYSNGQGSYCDIASELQLQWCGFQGGFLALPAFKDAGADVKQSPNPTCACGYNPIGCYRVGGGGFFANGQGASCPLAECQLPRICGTDQFFSLPDRPNTGADQVNGQCTNPAGCYRDNGGGYYSNGQGHACWFTMQQMPGICNVTVFDNLPVGCVGGDQPDGQCQ